MTELQTPAGFDLIGSVRSATQGVFSTMLGMELTEREAYVETGTTPPAEGVVALIGLAGQWIGTGALCCSAGFACQISSVMLMVEYSSVDGEVLDAVAEIANMVIGNVKTALEQELGPMGMSIPTVIFGKNFAARSVGDERWHIIPFEAGGECLEIKICLSKDRNAGPTRRGFHRIF